MRDFGAYAIAVAIVLSVLCCATFALASQTTPPVSNNTATIGTAPVGNDLSLIDIGGFLRQVGGFIRIGITTLISGSGGNGLGPTQPTDLVATPVSSSEIDLSWSPSTSNIGVAGYQVFRDGVQVASDTSGTSYNDTGLAASTLHSYWVAAYDTADNISTSTNGVSAVTEAGPDQYGTTWKPLRVGAGGFVTGIDIAPDDTMVVRTDTYGAYIWDGTQWDQLITSASMPAAFVQLLSGGGLYEIQIAPSDSNIMYMEYNGYVFVSTNRGVTWTETSFSPVSQAVDGANDSYRMNGQKMAVDPNNPNVVYVGTPQNGVFVSTNGGGTWQSVSGVPASQEATSSEYPGITGILFDPALGGTNASGNTNTIFAASWGNGVYESTNAGASWSSIGGPSYVENAAVSSTGAYYVISDNGTEETGATLWSYSNGTWTNLLTGDANGLHTVAVNPFNPNEVVVQTNGGILNVSLDGGSTWSGLDWTNTLGTNTIPWLASTNLIGGGGLVFDQTVSGKIYSTSGIGVWNATLPSNFTSSSAIVWNDQSLGIEQLVANEIISPPGGQPVVANDDFGDFYIANPDVFPSAHGTVSNQFAAGWAVDYASNDPSYVVAVTDGNGEFSGYSTNGGQTWNTFSTYPSDLIGGGIAAASSTDIVIFPSNNSVPYYTLNGGQTWNQISISGVPTSGETGWGFASYLKRFIVTADRVNIGTFYAYNYGPSGDSSAAGVYKSTNGGITWTQVYSGAFTDSGYNDSGFNAKLRAVPGIAGELFFTGGEQQGSLNDPVGEPFFESTNGGSTWSAVPNVLEVYDFGFGKAAPGTTTPAIYIVGFVNNKYGVWESDNNAETWTQIGLWPLGG